MTEVEGPLYRDVCEHGEDCYVGTVEVAHPGPGGSLARYDVYVFHNESLGQEMCLRFGGEGGDYCSPGRVVDLVKTAGFHWAKCDDTEYVAALELLMEKGQITWQRLPVKGSEYWPAREAEVDYAAVRGAELFAWTEQVLAAGELDAELRRQGDLLVYAIKQRVPFVLPGEEESSEPLENTEPCTCGHWGAWHDGDRGCVHQTLRGEEIVYCDCMRWEAQYPTKEGSDAD